MRASIAPWFALTAALGTALATACSGGGGTGGSGTTSGGAHDAGADAPATTTLRIDPDMTAATVTLGTAPAPVTFHAFAKSGGDAEQDVTAKVDWAVGAKIGAV